MIKVTHVDDDTIHDVDVWDMDSIETCGRGTRLKFQSRKPLFVKESRERVLELIEECVESILHGAGTNPDQSSNSPSQP